METRRQFLSTGFAALSAGLLVRRAGAGYVLQPRRDCFETGSVPLSQSGVFMQVPRHPQSVMVNGLPFAPTWFGDDFDNTQIPFHHSETQYPDGKAPAPTEEIDIAIVGGGLSGLATAYMLRQHRPVVFELHSRFGGTSSGEEWGNIRYSLGGAYFINPDAGSPLEALYRELGLTRQHADSPASDDPTELNGAIVPDFWNAPGLNENGRLAFRQYHALLETFVERYPEIPLVPNADNAWIRELDRISLKDHITAALTVPVPTLLEAAINGYCFSSFNAGWEEVSAACGWNFIAAEEFGRWILPGGNAGLVDALRQRLLHLEERTPRNCPPRHLRAGSRVVEVRVLAHNRVLVVHKGADGVFRSLIAKRVVMACPKHVAKWILTDMRATDPDRFQLCSQVNTNAYVVANVLLNRPVRTHFYDMFMLRNGAFDQNYDTAHPLRTTDIVNGAFAARSEDRDEYHDQRRNHVLTCYWPLSFPSGRFAAIADDALTLFATQLQPELDAALNIFHLTRSDVEQIRLTRWGHALPLAHPGLIDRGTSEAVRQPWRDHVFFVHCDNWSLPAVETCLQEAMFWAPRIAAGL